MMRCKQFGRIFMIVGFLTTSPLMALAIDMIIDNTDPVAVADTAVTTVDTATTIAVCANDTDADGDALRLHSVDDPVYGTASIVDGKVLYTPDAGYSGEENFGYTLADARGGTAAGKITVTVNAPQTGE